MKSDQNILTVIEAVANSTRLKSGTNRQVVFTNHNDQTCLILHSGIVSLYRKSDHLLVANIYAPALIGLNMLPEKQAFCLQARGPVGYEILPKDELFATVQTQQLWENLARYCIALSQTFIDNLFTIAGVSNWQLIRNGLMKLSKEGAEIKEATTVCDYVIERTMLSRSNIMNVLSQLKKGGYLEMKNGRLVTLNALPEKY